MIYRTSPRIFQYLTLFLIAFCGIQLTSAHAQCISVPPGQYCAGDNCSASMVPFKPNTPVANATYKWDFGDTSSQADTSNKQSPTYIYSKPGTYKVSLSINGGPPCDTTITINGFDEFTIDPDENKKTPLEEEICEDKLTAGIILSPKFTGTKPANPTYLWAPRGETTPTITIDTAGCYSVKITDPATGCSRTNKITITSYKPDPTKPPPPKETGRWYFGNKAGIKFVSGQPEVVTDSKINVTQGSSTVSDLSGKLLFYTDGKDIYRPDGNVMPGGDNLNGGANVTQGVLIVAQPGCASCNSVYYVYTISDTGELKYSIVDMRDDGGKGTVKATEKNLIPQDSPLKTTERITAVAGEPDATTGALKTWIITHDAGNNTFRVYPFTGQGLGKPDTSQVGAIHGPEAVKSEGYMKVSPDGSKIAVVIPGVAPGTNNQVQLFDFDKKTGKVSNPKNIDLGKTPPSAYGIEFSSDTTLYVSLTGDGTAANPSQLVQYSVQSKDTIVIANSRKVIATSATDKYGALQIDPDRRRVYMAIEGKSSLAVINQPNNPLNEDYQANGADLGGAVSQLGLPNISPTENTGMPQPGFSFDGPPCTPKGVAVTYEFVAQPDRAEKNVGDYSSYEWVFPAGTTPTTSTAKTPSVSFPGPGSYIVKLKIKNDCITAGEDFTKTITIKQAPDPFKIQPNAPNIRQVNTINTCEPSVKLDAQAQPNALGSTYQWFFDGKEVTPNGKSQTITVTQSGNYSVVVANGTCGQTDNVFVNFNSPQPNLGADTTLCSGGTLTLNAGYPGYGYVWSNGKTDQFITVPVNPGTSTTYTVTVTDPITGCKGSDAIKVTGGTPSTFTMSSTPTKACGAAGTDNGTVTVNGLLPAAGPFTFAWTGPNGYTSTNQPTITNLAAGTYTVVVTNAIGCSTTKQASVNSLATPVSYSTITPVTTICSATPTGTFTLTKGVTSTTATSFLWKDSANKQVGTNSATLTAKPGIYSVEITDAGGCKQFLSNLEILPATGQPTVKASPAIQTNCTNYTLIAQANGGNEFEWKKITENNVITAPIPISSISTAKISNQQFPIERYTVSVYQDKAMNPSCFAIDTITVSLPPATTAVFTITQGAANVCDGETVTLTANSPPAGLTYVYQWQKDGNEIPGETGRVLSIVESGLSVALSNNYTVIVRNPQSLCPPVSFSQFITFKPIPQTDFESSDTTICRGDAATLVAKVEVGTSYTYTWVNKTTGQTIPNPGNVSKIQVTPSSTTVYTLTISNKIGITPSTKDCKTSKDIMVTVNDQPKVDFSKEPKTFCENSFLVLHANPKGNPKGSVYEWKKDGVVLAGRIEDTLQVNKSGSYSVLVTLGQCTATAEHNVNPPLKVPVPNPPRRQIPFCDDLEVNPSGTTKLDAGPGNLVKYEWYNLDFPNTIIDTNQVFYQGVGIYKVKYINENFCSDSTTITVYTECEPRVFIPEAFAPNSDIHDNKKFYLRYPKYIQNLEVKIYNRWGELIVSQKIVTPVADQDGNLEIWDGTFKGQPSPVGSYVWTISYDSDTIPDRTVKKRGGVALIR